MTLEITIKEICFEGLMVSAHWEGTCTDSEKRFLEIFAPKLHRAMSSTEKKLMGTTMIFSSPLTMTFRKVKEK